MLREPREEKNNAARANFEKQETGTFVAHSNRNAAEAR